MPYYTYHMDDVLEEAGIPLVKAYRIRVDEYVQDMLGLRDAEPEEVWAVLHPKLKEPDYRAWFVRELRRRWEARDWTREGL